MVRPEALQVRPRRQTATASLSGRVIHVAFMGNHTRVTVDTAAGAVVALRPHSEGADAIVRAVEELLDRRYALWWGRTDADRRSCEAVNGGG